MIGYSTYLWHEGDLLEEAADLLQRVQRILEGGDGLGGGSGLGGSVLRTAPLTPKELLFTMLLALSVFPIEFLRKLVLRLFGNKKGF